MKFSIFFKNTIKTIKTTMTSLSIVILLTVCVLTSASAQTPPVSPDRGAKLGNSYAVGDFENINTTNGNLMLNFPLGSLSPGRGGISSGISLTYNSKLYNMNSIKMPDYRHFDAYFYKTVINQDYKGGWSLIGGVRLEIENRMDSYGEYAPQCTVGNNELNDQIIYNQKLRIVLPDGSTHEMIPHGHYDKLGDRYFNIDMNGRVQSCYSSPTYTTPPTYFSLDGSYLRLQPTSIGDWTLYLPDGGKVVQSANQSSQKIYDRNGNYVTVSPTQVSDEFGRTVSVTADTNGDQLVTSKGFGGADLVWRIKWKMITVSKTYISCPDSHSCPPEDQTAPLQANFGVVDKIIQPQQLGGGEYVFTYNAPNTNGTPTQASYGWGEVSGIQLPTGAQVNYEYAMDGQDGPGFFDNNKLILKNYPTSKTLTYNAEYDGVSTPVTETTGYSITNTESLVTSPDGGVTSTEFYTTEPVGPGEWQSGLTLKTTGPDGTKKENLWDRNLPVKCTNVGPPCPGISINADNPYVKTEFTSIKNSSGSYTLTAVKDYEYDKNGNVIQIKDYDFMPYSSIPRDGEGRPTGLPTNAASFLKRITKTDFYNDTPSASSTNYSDPDSYHSPSSLRLLRLVKSTEVQDGTGVPQTRSEISYDFTDYILSNTKGGNPTETKAWDSYKGGASRAYSNPLTSTNSIATSASYDPYGNVVQTIDANNVQTTLTYGNISTPSGTVTGLYPTQTEAASNYSSIKRTSTAVYDFYTGLKTSTTDVDNGVTSGTDYDDLGRPTKTKTAVGTSLEAWTQTVYNDVNRRVIVKSDLETKGDARKVATQFYDQLGRVRLAKTLEDSATQSATNETDGIKVQTRYLTTSGGYSYQLTSNPYRANYSSNAGSEQTMGWTRSKSYKDGQHSEVETFAGATLPQPFLTSSYNTASTGKVQTYTDADRTLVTDQSGKQRISKTNALGQLINVWEVKTADADTESLTFGSLSLNALKTSYAYDPLNNLTTVTQGGQTRSFSYSSLSRLKSATNPESGTINYSYDNNGNLSQKTDARSIATSYSYDALNRVTSRDYSDATPDIAYTYDDVNVPFSKGKLTKIASAAAETRYTAFDAQDRTLSTQQIIDGQTYSFGYTYKLSGNLLTQTYPSGKVIQFDYTNDGDLAQVSNQQTQKVYANSFSYSPHGKVERMRFGNGKWETTQFNSVLQITQIGLGHSATDTGLWKTNYEYGDWENGAINSQKNNGNSARQTFVVPTIGQAAGFTAVQNYTYDSLDRLKSAEETVGGVQKWKQAFLYDRYTNRNFDTANTTLQSLESNVPKVVNPEIDAAQAKNQYKQDQDNDGQADYLYDAGGNLTKDAQNRTFTYDAENRQTTAAGSNLSMSYSYDGNGKRVKTFNAVTNQMTVFVYDTDGDLAAEYTLNVPAPQNPTISYLTEDALGSVRVTTDSFGQIKARRDFLPFGEEIYAGIGNRTANQSYSSNADDTRKKFATYQRDAETNLDFAQSRYYSPMQGRFTSPDEFKGGPDELFDFAEDASDNPTFYADLENPQSLNKYQYTYNNPYKYNDPTGHVTCPPECPAQITMPYPLVGEGTAWFFGRPPVPIIVTPDGKSIPRSETLEWEDGSITDRDGNILVPAPRVGRGGAQADPLPPTPKPQSNSRRPAPQSPTMGKRARKSGRTVPTQQPKPNSQPQRQPGEHTKNKRNSTKDKHTKPRSGQKKPPNYKGPKKRPQEMEP